MLHLQVRYKENNWTYECYWDDEKKRMHHKAFHYGVEFPMDFLALNFHSQKPMTKEHFIRFISLLWDTME